jgi:hypothetical protein
MATDSFTNSNGVELQTHSANWLAGNMLSSDFVIDTNAVRTPLNRGITLFAYYTGTFSNNQYSEATIIQFGSVSNQHMGVVVRASGGNAYGFNHDNAGWLVQRTQSYGIPVELDAGSRSPSANDVLRLEVSGTTLTAKINGVTVSTVTDSAIASGSPGIGGIGGAASGTYTLLDSWTGADLTTSSVRYLMLKGM